MHRRKPDGMLMMAVRQTGSGNGGGSPTGKKPPGVAFPAIATPAQVTPPVPPSTPPSGALTIDTPIPVVLTHRTLLKLIGGIVGPLLLLGSAGAYFLHATMAHMGDPTVHLNRGERGKLQTKSGCMTSTKKLSDEIKREQRINHREVLLKQKVQIQKIGSGLKQDQRRAFKRILTAVKRGHRSTRRAIRRNVP